MDKQAIKKRKKKDKDYVRKMAFLVGQDRPPIVRANVPTFKKIKSFFESLVKDNPLIAVRSTKERRNKLSDDKKPTSQETVKGLGLDIFRGEVQFGLNKTIRKIPKKELSAVILTDPISIHLKKSLHEMCCEYQVPFILLPKLSDIRSVLNISSLTCMAFSHKIKEPESVCHQLYNLIAEYISKFNENFSTNPSTDCCPEELTCPNPEDKESESKEPEFTFKFPAIEDLMIPVENTEKYLGSREANTSLNTSQDVSMEFISFTESDCYYGFPHRPYFDNHRVKLDLNLFPTSSAKGKDFATSLFSPSAPHNNSQAKIARDSSKAPLIRGPKIVHLPVSKKGKMKKEVKKTKKS